MRGALTCALQPNDDALARGQRRLRLAHGLRHLGGGAHLAKEAHVSTVVLALHIQDGFAVLLRSMWQDVCYIIILGDGMRRLLFTSGQAPKQLI